MYSQPRKVVNTLRKREFVTAQKHEEIEPPAPLDLCPSPSSRDEKHDRGSFKCEFCERTFTEKRFLYAHLRVHK